jgi:DNA-binding HxlR family transcriptional regulator
VLSNTWTLMIVRDIAYYKLSRYHEFLKNNPGLSERVLSRRLAEMVREGFLARVEEGGDVRYRLAEKGEDTVPILLGFLAFGIKHHAERVFPDKQPRSLAEAFPQFDAGRVAAMLRVTP